MKRRLNPIDPFSVDFQSFLNYAYDYYSEIVKLVKRLAEDHGLTYDQVIRIMQMSPLKYLYDEWNVAYHIQEKYIPPEEQHQLQRKAEEIVQKAMEETER